MNYYEMPTSPDTFAKVKAGRPFMVTSLSHFQTGDVILLSDIDTEEHLVVEVERSDSVEADDLHVVIIKLSTEELPEPQHTESEFIDMMTGSVNDWLGKGGLQ